jgi:hypothetical protein
LSLSKFRTVMSIIGATSAITVVRVARLMIVKVVKSKNLI